jgi:hypothetical protein
MQKMFPRSIMFPPATWEVLRRMAHRESLKTGKDITASALVREMVEVQLFGERQGGEEAAAQPVPAEV